MVLEQANSLADRSVYRSVFTIFTALMLFTAFAMFAFVSLRYAPQDNSQLQTIVVDREGNALPRVPLSRGFVPVLGTKCLKADHPVEIAGTGPNWIVLGPVGGVSVQGNSGSTTLDPNGVDEDGKPIYDADGCRTSEFDNPIPEAIADAAVRQGEIEVRIFGVEEPIDPLTLNPLKWRPGTGLPGFFPVEARWRTENFVIFDDTTGKEAA